jgi:hypothetical protein
MIAFLAARLGISALLVKIVGALVIAASLLAAGWALYGHVYGQGFRAAESACQEAAQTARADALELQLRMTQEVLAAELEKLQEQVRATPENDAAGLPADAARRIGGVR